MRNQLGGRFVDRLVHENDTWLIMHRIVTRDWTIALPVKHDWESARSLTCGSAGTAAVITRAWRCFPNQWVPHHGSVCPADS
jgi:hypothetical protein